MVKETELKNLPENNNLTKEEKIELIKQYYASQIKQFDKELNTYLFKMWSGEALELLSCLIPVGAGTKLGTTTGKTLLTTKLGRAITEKVLKSKLSAHFKNISQLNAKVEDLFPKSIGKKKKKLSKKEKKI